MKISHSGAGTDNSFLFVLVTTGILGLLSFIYLLARMISIGVNKNKFGSEYGNILLASIVTMTVGSMFVNALFFPTLMLWMWILIGVTENS